MTELVFSASMFAAVAVAVSTEETRFYLRGVYLEPTGTGHVRMTATDGHILLTAQTLCENGAKFEPFILSIGAQSDAILKACRLAKAVELVLSMDSKMWSVRSATGAELALGRWQSVDGTFPDYRRIFPQDSSPRAEAVPLLPKPAARFRDAARLVVGDAYFTLWPRGYSDASLVTFSNREDIVGLWMPAVVKTTDRVPLSAFSWVRGS